MKYTTYDKTHIEKIMENVTKQFTVKIVSSRGHDIFTGSALEVLGRIKKECSENHKWCNMNGLKLQNPERLTVDDIMDAFDITLTNEITSGNSQY